MSDLGTPSLPQLLRLDLALGSDQLGGSACEPGTGSAVGIGCALDDGSELQMDSTWGFDLDSDILLMPRVGMTGRFV